MPSSSSRRPTKQQEQQEDVCRAIVIAAPKAPTSDHGDEKDDRPQLKGQSWKSQQHLRSSAPPPRRAASEKNLRFTQAVDMTSTTSSHDKQKMDNTIKSSHSNNNNHDSTTARERLALYNATIGVNDDSAAGMPGASKHGRKKQQTQSLYTESRVKTLVPLLALQAYHLPGNSWCQDWIQFTFQNNHPVFGICCHHPLHPIGACTRIVALLGSIIFGLALTNLFFLFFLLNPSFNQVVLVVQAFDDEWQLTTGMLLLWTVGGSIHAGYNLTMWHIAACACCRVGGCLESIACCPGFGKRLIRVFLLISIAFGALVVLLRVGIANNETFDETAEMTTTDAPQQQLDGLDDDDNLINGIEIVDEFDFSLGEAEEFNFLVGYLVEMVLSLFIYYPLGGTILFSGCLGCGCIPVLGGRAAEVAAEERHRKRRQQYRDNDENFKVNMAHTGETLASSASASRRRAEDGGAQTIPNDQDVELMWTPQAARDFERQQQPQQQQR